MSSWGRRLCWGGAAVLALAAGVGGLYVGTKLGPEHLRRLAESQIAAATGAPCSLAALRIEPGLPMELEAHGLALWDGRLAVERARARVSLAAALVGEVHFTRLELDGATLEIESGGSRSPWPWGESAAETTPGAADAAGDPVAKLRDGVAAALAAPLFADTLRLRDGRIELRDGAGGEDVVLEDLNGELSQSRLRGRHSLVVQARIRAGGAHRGLLEAEVVRRDRGALRATVTATDLDLGWLGGRLGARHSGPRGWVSGVADLEADDPESAEIDLDLVARDFAWLTSDDRPLLAAPRVAARGRAVIDAKRVAVTGARIRSGPLSFAIDADLARPITAASSLGVRLRLQELAVDDLRDLLTGMRASWLEDARVALDALDGGRVVELTARARGPVGGWDDFTSDGVAGLPQGLALRARLEDLRLRLGERDAIEQIAIDASWRGDRLVLRDVRGVRGGFALPRLDLQLDGVSHLLASNLDDRVPDSEQVQLLGLPLLLSLFQPNPDFSPPHVEVRLERLDHPALLWPMRSVELAVDARAGGLKGELRRATWADVPLRGTLEWSDDPMHLTAHLEAGAATVPESAPAASTALRTRQAAGSEAPPAGAWSVGSFEIGPMRTSVWAHERVVGRFRAAGSAITFDGVEAELTPTGRLTGVGGVDLSRADALTYHARLAAEELDADAFFEHAGLGDDRVSGRVALSAELRNRYQPGRHPFASLSGRVDLDARDGQVRHELPAVLALSLAGEGLGFQRDRDRVRFSRCVTHLEFDEGVARTESLTFEGPDVRLYGAGSLDLGHAPFPLDAEVVVLLFRPVDRVLGAVPILGTLILGGADNLIAAHFRIRGPWDAPTATAQPLRSLNAGPLRLVTGLPGFVRRGLETLEGAMPGSQGEPQVAPPADGAVP